jgi:type IV secretion system protein VirB9
MSLSLCFIGCAAPRPHPPAPPLAEAVRVQEPAPPAPLTPPTDGQLLNTESPDVQAAFDRYVQTGKAPLIDKRSAGFVQYPYGLSQPTVSCRPLELCDIELAPGEEILDLAAGDQERWVFQPLRSGPADRRVVHVMAKPTDLTRDMQTTIVIGTTQRTYRIRLLSRRQGTIVNARFYYPQDMVQHFNRHQAEQQHAAETVAATLPAVSLDALDDRYTIEGEQAWRPTWVANDGTRTYLKMPAALHATEAPALFVQSPSGEHAITNFRVKGGYYVVDALFDRAMLSWGVGSNKQTVTISRNP